MYGNGVKRLLDFLVSLVLLVLLSPIFLTVLIILLVTNHGKPFFVQPRPGRDEKTFRLLKFKTMTDARDKNNTLLPDTDRLTKVGIFVRKTSLDEIPQLINVLKGDMSLIGPRPLLMRYLPYYSERERKRHQVRPGITGLAQVSGRNNLNWDDRLAMDVKYVENLSFTLDVKIFFKTIKSVLSSKDIVVDAGAVIPDLDVYRSKA
ncbi:sugar transferase [Flavobacteriaceae bacterium TP-CH-4]|uniref:Sugar transferase n=1 Tax=Pelagihabitans pacificus TaxID=2696054 RepID=A0A967AXE1_9FLAO|nr:sugar transferase [Pelagihabitans pacificus]NHF61070.1 sugar transferase [Pelagihabitans pacificus]